jgi:hypothetical protein
MEIVGYIVGGLVVAGIVWGVVRSMTGKPIIPGTSSSGGKKSETPKRPR